MCLWGDPGQWDKTQDLPLGSWVARPLRLWVSLVGVVGQESPRYSWVVSPEKFLDFRVPE